MQQPDSEITSAVTKVAVAWLAGLAGMKLGDWVLLATLVYTLLQTFFLLRDKWYRQRRK